VATKSGNLQSSKLDAELTQRSDTHQSFNIENSLGIAKMLPTYKHMPSSTNYRGRFAPSPTGPLHFGSLVAAVGSYLDAKHHQGTWLARMEDVDAPRCSPEASEDILRTLETFGLHSDEPVLYQSQRTSAYEEALAQLQASGAVYPCCCTRKEIADSALHGIEGLVYPGTCRDGISTGREGWAWRVRTNYYYRHSRGVNFALGLPSSKLPTFSAGGNPVGLNKMHVELLDSRLRGNDEARSVAEEISFNDALQGCLTQNIESEIGDFVVKRANGLFAYQLAVVVDDAFQDITHIVRGADLLTSTARQIYLQYLLGLTTPAYMHLPVAVNAAGEKLSKQTLAAPVDISKPAETLMRVLNFLQQKPPGKLADDGVEAVLDWAIQHWDATQLRGLGAQPAFVIPA
jgi:glutamyl-Q tRNA(Asp) synthetase